MWFVIGSKKKLKFWNFAFCFKGKINFFLKFWNFDFFLRAEAKKIWNFEILPQNFLQNFAFRSSAKSKILEIKFLNFEILLKQKYFENFEILLLSKNILKILEILILAKFLWKFWKFCYFKKILLLRKILLEAKFCAKFWNFAFSKFLRKFWNFASGGAAVRLVGSGRAGGGGVI